MSLNCSNLNGSVAKVQRAGTKETLKMPPLTGSTSYNLGMAGVVQTASSLNPDLSPRSLALKTQATRDSDSLAPLNYQPTKLRFEASESPCNKISKNTSKQSLGTIYSSGTALQNHFNQQPRRQSQFRSSRLYQHFHQTAGSGTQSNPPGAHNLSQQNPNKNHMSNSDIQSLSTLNHVGGSNPGNQSLERLPQAKLNQQLIYTSDDMQPRQSHHSPPGLSKHNNSSFHHAASLGTGSLASTCQVPLAHRSKFINSLPHQQQYPSQYEYQQLQYSKRLSLYQKRMQQKLKLNQVSLSNISVGDERSADIILQDDFINLPHNHQNPQQNTLKTVDRHQQLHSSSPYKTLNNFNNLKYYGGGGGGTISGTGGVNAKSSKLPQQYPYSIYYNQQNDSAHSVGAHNLSLHGGQKSSKQGGKNSEIASERHPAESLSHQPLILLKIEEDNNELKSRARHHQIKEGSLSKVSSKTEFPELRQSTFKNRIRNNQSINVSRIQQITKESLMNSQTSSRTQLAQLVNLESHHLHNQGKRQLDPQALSSGVGLMQNSATKKSNKIKSIRINQELINQQQNQAQQLPPQRDPHSQSPPNKKFAKQQHHKKEPSSGIPLNTQTSITSVGSAGQQQQQQSQQHKIRIEINKEESIVNYLTKDHKTNMSLLFYDFNNSNQRMHSKPRPHQNLADLVIPEEADEVVGAGPAHPNGLSSSLTTDSKGLAATFKDLNTDDALLTQQETLLQEIFNGERQNFSSAMKPIGTTMNNHYSISPRNEAVELVNQKIDNAKKKMSRYFPHQPASYQPQGGLLPSTQNSSQQMLTTVASSSNNQVTNKNKAYNNQNSLTHLSMDMVRLGSPFFGTHVHNSIAMSFNQNSPLPQRTQPLKGQVSGTGLVLLNNKQSDSSLKFSPLKQQKEQPTMGGFNTSQSRNTVHNKSSLMGGGEDDFSFNNDQAHLQEFKEEEDGESEYSNDSFQQDDDPEADHEVALVESRLDKLPQIEQLNKTESLKPPSHLGEGGPTLKLKRIGESVKRISTVEYVKESDEFLWA